MTLAAFGRTIGVLVIGSGLGAGCRFDYGVDARGIGADSAGRSGESASGGSAMGGRMMVNGGGSTTGEGGLAGRSGIGASGTPSAGGMTSAGGTSAMGGTVDAGGTTAAGAGGTSAMGGTVDAGGTTAAGEGQACVVHGYSNCPSGLICDHGAYSPPACPPYFDGTCVDPTKCTPILSGPPGSPPMEVCGCDGVTYSDSCARLRSGTDLYQLGPC